MSNESILSVIEELDRISNLHLRKCELDSELEHITSDCEQEKTDETDKILHDLKQYQSELTKKMEASVPMLPTLGKTSAPKRPIKETLQKGLLGAVAGLGAYIFFALWIILVIVNPDESSGVYAISFLLPVLLIASIVLWVLNQSKVEAYIEWKTKQTEWDQQIDEHIKEDEKARFLKECSEFDGCFLALVEKCDERFNDAELKHQAMMDEITQKYLKKLDVIHSEFNEIFDQLAEVTLIHIDHFEHAWRISSMLKTGRADSLTEAINLAIDEDRKEKEEATRQEEARRQEAILEQQAYDNRMHNEAMQRTAERQARATEAQARAAEAQARATEAQAREAAKQTQMAEQKARNDAMNAKREERERRQAEHNAKTAAMQRCYKCANYQSCGASRGNPNCGSFRAKN